MFTRHRLDEAEALWPAWLRKQWLPYFRAALTLRTDSIEAFEAERLRICEEADLETIYTILEYAMTAAVAAFGAELEDLLFDVR